LLEKTAKVKPVSARVLALRAEAAAASIRSATNLKVAKRARSPSMQSEFGFQHGFTTFIKRKVLSERASAATADDAQAAAAGVAAQPLGNNTKLQAVFRDVIDENTDEIQRLTLDESSREYVVQKDPKVQAMQARAARYSAQTAGGKLLFNHLTPRSGQWRVTGCARRKISEVTILYSAKVEKAHFGGLMICGSVWTCPPCAAKISERRKQEITQATNTFTAGGGRLYMISHTFSHGRADDLVVTMEKFRAAMTFMRAQRAYKKLRVAMGFVGDIRALEVTYGDANGFHPHEHDLWLVSDKLTRHEQRALQAGVFECWLKACGRAGLGLPNRKRGVDVKAMDSAADYLAKVGRESTWGTASELTKQHSKVGKVGRWTPFDLLRLYEGGDKRMGALFIQFADAFFGKQQVRWSKGLKAMFGVTEVSDEELAVQEAEDAKVMVEITAFEWRVILKQPYDVRALVLTLAETGGIEAVKLYLQNLTADEIPF
jgi:hypothetical protein